jgi:hypothetical protein
MPGAIKLVPFGKVFPFFVRVINCKVGIEIAVFFLGAANKGDNVVSGFLQFRVRTARKAVRYRL